MPLEKGLIAVDSQQHALFINGSYFPAYPDIACGSFEAVQAFKPLYTSSKEMGWDIQPDIDNTRYEADVTLIALPKNQIEAVGLIAHGLLKTKAGGHVCIAAGSKGGGNRIVKNLKRFGIEDVQQETANRCRVVWFTRGDYDEEAVKDALEESGIQSIADGQFVSQPGIYGWNKIDKGSALLAACLPEGPFANGADIGCGYGYLSVEALQKWGCTSWHYADADFRAVEICGQNLEKHSLNSGTHPHWIDCTQKLPFSGLDVIVMNPPFHEGQKGDPEIGNAFIRNASNALKNKGELWMVANNHLPYERVLKAEFRQVEKRAEEQGFKVYRCVK
ncbi:MAG: class I SAM-dependent methyltransferase [Alphaproteobacteria bacterium]|nr:class I SAM-dependent methyltransferase [Alphaproteobacteria bacterium]